LGLGIVSLGAEESRAFSYGLPIFRLESFASLEGSAPTAAFDPEGDLLGIVIRYGSAWKYAFVIGSPV